MSTKGLLITFEGGEGCGKSYQSSILNRRLAELAIPVIMTHEPGGTPFGEKITRLLKWDNKQKISPLTETLLFNASRAHLIENVIKPALRAGKIVICDRFTDSTVVYQGFSRGLDVKLIEPINRAATQSIAPDLTILLDLPVEAGLSRKNKQKPDRFHKENLAFHRRVRNGFLKQAMREPGRWFFIDASQPREKIAGIIWERVVKLLADRSGG